MEPTSLTATAIATLVLTEVFKRTGQQIGDKALEQSSKLFKLLKTKFSSTATKIEQARQQPSKGQIYSIQQEVEAAAQADPEVDEAVQAVASTVQTSPISNQYFTQANEIGQIVNGNIHIKNLKNIKF